MSFLTPLYALGILAVAAPIVFHLIRRAPRGEVTFSSLMFLAPTPPRLSRRSRLDHVLLLLLRATALCLLALAFARPFLRRAARLDSGELARRRVAVLIDTSASMRRGTLWPKAKALADGVIAGCRPADDLAVFAFDATSRPVLSFAESATLESSRRRAIARARLDRLAPSWGATHLGQALIDAVSAIEDVADASEKAGRMPRRVVLISDLQQGSRVEALGDFEWPSDVELELKTVADPGSNAGLHPLADPVESGPLVLEPQRRVRVSNDLGSRREAFALRFVDAKGVATGAPVSVYVPPGESRVVRVPRPQGKAPLRSLRLEGDDRPFDNTLYFADDRREEATVLYVGKDAADDPAGLLYYLQRVFPDTALRTVRVRPLAASAALPADLDRQLPLVVVAGETTLENARRLRARLREGGTLLYVANAAGKAATLAALADVAPFDLAEATVGRDVMLGAIAFDHPLFAPMAGAQFNDFTKIHFWHYRRIVPEALGNPRVLARFENGDPAVVETPVGRGRLVAFASGWQPADSQLARSSKFVPLMASLLEGPDARPPLATLALVHDRVALPFPRGEGAARGMRVRTPDGNTVAVEAGSTTFAATDQPGVYTLDTRGGARSFAVNLDPLESKTAPMPVETLEQLGCRLESRARKGDDRAYQRQLQSMELEGRQKLWRWLILTVIGILIVETWLAGRLSRPHLVRAEALTS